MPVDTQPVRRVALITIAHLHRFDRASAAREIDVNLARRTCPLQPGVCDCQWCRWCRWKMSQPKFMWKSGSKWKANGKGFYAAAVIYNTDNGIRSVEQMSGNKWVKLSPLQHLGNMWVLQRPPDSEYRSPSGGSGKSIKLRVTDAQGKQYGSYSVSWMCGSGVCSSEVDAPAKKIG